MCREWRERVVNITRLAAASLIGVGVASAYGLAAHDLFSSPLFFPLGPLSISFLFLVPPALGLVTVALAPNALRRSLVYALLAPIPPMAVAMAISVAFKREFLFCVLLALPFALPLAIVGGLIAYALRTSASARILPAALLSLSMPFLAAPLEVALPLQPSMQSVHSTIEIGASPEAVWEQITNVARVGPGEARPAFFHALGLPRPLEARMSCEERGCVRLGEWEDGLAFTGTVSAIEHGRSYWVSLEADTASLASPNSVLAMIGGQTFAMVDDGYLLEPLGPGRSRLHLYSTYRLQSRINFYAAPVLDFLMRDIQHYLLELEKTRSEGPSGP